MIAGFRHMTQLLHHKSPDGMEISINRVRQLFDREQLRKLFDRQGTVHQPRPVFALSSPRFILSGLFRRDIPNDGLQHIL